MQFIYFRSLRNCSDTLLKQKLYGVILSRLSNLQICVLLTDGKVSLPL